MRIANIIEEGRLGGPQVRIARVARCLKGYVDTTVVMPDEESELFQRQCDQMAIPYQTIRISRVSKDWRVAFRYIFFSCIEVVRLANFIRSMKFDIVHVSGGSWQYKGIIAGKLAGRKVLWHLNDTSMPRVIRWLFSMLSRYSDGFIFASEMSKRYYSPLLKNGKQKFLISEPVDTGEFDPSLHYRGDEELIATWAGKTVIGMVANVSPVKGLETFVRAMADLNRKHEGLHFLVLGAIYKRQRRYFEKLQRLCKCLEVDNVEFLGGRADVRPILKRFDIYVCSSNSEASPMAVWEAMGMGKPVVSTDVGDVSFYLRDSCNGFIVPVRDSVSLGERVSRLVENDQLRRQFGHNAREVAVRKLDIQLCAKLHFNAYSRVLGRHDSSYK